jgi:hypothetical protein
MQNTFCEHLLPATSDLRGSVVDTGDKTWLGGEKAGVQSTALTPFDTPDLVHLEGYGNFGRKVTLASLKVASFYSGAYLATCAT